MKHRLKIVFLLLAMFVIAQLIGLYVANSYLTTSQGTLPSWIEPPKDVAPQLSLISIIVAIIFGVVLMFILMAFRAEMFFRIWFFLVVSIAMAITLNSVLSSFAIPFIIALIVSVPFAFLKVFQRNIKIHNLTELLIYPGVASLFIPLLNIPTAVLLLVAISLYDMYAVWHAGFMQKMAQYQIKQLKFFSGFFVPYLSAKDKIKLSKSKSKSQKLKVNVAILGGGDVVFPIIFAGVVLSAFGLISALIITLGATLALAGLFYISEKGKFYPAMPFISAGCLLALGIVYLIRMF